MSPATLFMMQHRLIASNTILIALMVALTAMSGCRRDFTTEADALRERVMTLEREVEALQRQNTELKAQLRRRDARQRPIDDKVLAATPQAVELTISRLSHARAADSPDADDMLRIYVNPIDGRGRFVPLVGTMRVHAVIIQNDGPVSLASSDLSPDRVRDAYRSSFTGSHYTIRLPIDWPESVDRDLARSEPIIVQVRFIDGVSGLELLAERSVGWRTGR